MFSPRLRRGVLNFYCSMTSAAEISASRQHQRGEITRLLRTAQARGGTERNTLIYSCAPGVIVEGGLLRFTGLSPPNK
jgi:hypothetical protein